MSQDLESTRTFQGKVTTEAGGVVMLVKNKIAESNSLVIRKVTGEVLGRTSGKKPAGQGSMVEEQQCAEGGESQEGGEEEV